MVEVAHTFTFNVLHLYDTTASDITIPVKLSVGDKQVIIPDAKLDTGASFCIFQQSYGELLEVDIERGSQEQIKTATGSFLAYGHELSLSTLGFEFLVTVYFASLPGFSRNVLGRRGWLNQIGLGLIDYEGKLYASKYDDMI